MCSLCEVHEQKLHCVRHVHPFIHFFRPTGHISTSVVRQVSFQCNSTPTSFETQIEPSVFSKVVYHIKIAHVKYSSN